MRTKLYKPNSTTELIKLPCYVENSNPGSLSYTPDTFVVGKMILSDEYASYTKATIEVPAEFAPYISEGGYIVLSGAYPEVRNPIIRGKVRFQLNPAIWGATHIDCTVRRV